MVVVVELVVLDVDVVLVVLVVDVVEVLVVLVVDVAGTAMVVAGGVDASSAAVDAPPQAVAINTNPDTARPSVARSGPGCTKATVPVLGSVGGS